jgi:prepilin-type N-terminal cleavage/methylation domain-containing protein
MQRSQKGFTLIELLIVISIIGIMLAVSLPVSFAMYSRYKASLKAQEIMVYISDLRRDSFLYSENKIMTSSKDAIMIDENSRSFEDTRIRIDTPIEFYKNGTTSGGVIRLFIRDYAFIVRIEAPLGGLMMEAAETQ